MMLLGLRGAGKTVLLNRLHGIAEKEGLRMAKVEAPQGGMLPQLLVPELGQVHYSLDLEASADSKFIGRPPCSETSLLRSRSESAISRLESTRAGVKPTPGISNRSSPICCRPMRGGKERPLALEIVLDEVQYLSPEELALLIAAYHEVRQRSLPIFFVGAGMPQIAALAGNAKSYAERLFTYPEVGQLDATAADAALVHPAQNEGVDFEIEVVGEILRLTECHPYFIQEWGSHVWNFAPESPNRCAYVQEATPWVIAHLDANFLRVRFDRFTPLQQKYLRALAELGAGPDQTGDITAMLGVEAQSRCH